MLKNSVITITLFILLLSCNSNKQISTEFEINLDLVYGVWAFEKSDPHASFMINKDEFYIVDYDGDGSIKYTLKGNQLKIFYDEFTQWGKITSVTKDSLKIKWRDTEIETKYVRFPED
jgi:hypothetical protein